MTRREREALDWLERVGCWPSDDPEIRRRTREAERILKFPRTEPRNTDREPDNV